MIEGSVDTVLPVTGLNAYDLSDTSEIYTDSALPGRKSANVVNTEAKPGYSGNNNCININTADSAKIESLPGIGPALTQRIIAFRMHGRRFAGPQDLLEIKGIGSAKLEKIRQLVCF
jgi:competence protein ComEA